MDSTLQLLPINESPKHELIVSLTSKFPDFSHILGYSSHSNINRHTLTSSRNRQNGIRSQDHDLLQFEVPIAPEKVILDELNASERK